MRGLLKFNETTRIIERLISVGVDREQAKDVALSMVAADIYGVTTHGSEMLENHVKKLFLVDII